MFLPHLFVDSLEDVFVSQVAEEDEDFVEFLLCLDVCHASAGLSEHDIEVEREMPRSAAVFVQNRLEGLLHDHTANTTTTTTTTRRRTGREEADKETERGPEKEERG